MQLQLPSSPLLICKKSLVFPALDLIKDGCELYAVSYASGGTSVDAHERRMHQIIQAAAVPVTWETEMAD
ncbi:MAG: hypothetical protein IIA61_05640 [Candidatus Marinimicrobia bacterium]|nr:hypothetical protein [Candidatus Neomarinimicrobiota bacterium]